MGNVLTIIAVRPIDPDKSPWWPRYADGELAWCAIDDRLGWTRVDESDDARAAWDDDGLPRHRWKAVPDLLTLWQNDYGDKLWEYRLREYEKRPEKRAKTAKASKAAKAAKAKTATKTKKQTKPKAGGRAKAS